MDNDFHETHGIFRLFDGLEVAGLDRVFDALETEAGTSMPGVVKDNGVNTASHVDGESTKLTNGTTNGDKKDPAAATVTGHDDKHLGNGENGIVSHHEMNGIEKGSLEKATSNHEKNLIRKGDDHDTTHYNGKIDKASSTLAN